MSLLLSLLIAQLATSCAMGFEPQVVSTRIPRPTALPAEIVQKLVAQPNTVLGAQVFSENCTACHGLGGRGDGSSVQRGAITGVPDFTMPSTMTVADPAAIYAVITEGRLEKYMPPWGSILSEEQRWAVAMYVYQFMQAE